MAAQKKITDLRFVTLEVACMQNKVSLRKLLFTETSLHLRKAGIPQKTKMYMDKDPQIANTL